MKADNCDPCQTCFPVVLAGYACFLAIFSIPALICISILFSSLPEVSSRPSWTPSWPASWLKMVILELRQVSRCSSHGFSAIFVNATFVEYLGPFGPDSHRDHHSGHPYPERFGWEGKAHPRTDIRGPEEVWLPGGHCWALCWEGCHSWSVRHCSGWIPALQAHWRLGCAKVTFFWTKWVNKMLI